jgi:hypothetical protein
MKPLISLGSAKMSPAIAHHGCVVISAALDLGDGGALLCLQIMAKTIKN